MCPETFWLVLQMSASSLLGSLVHVSAHFEQLNVHGHLDLSKVGSVSGRTVDQLYIF